MWIDRLINEGLGGLGVDEPAMVSALAKWRRQPEKLSGFRKSFNGFFKDHGGVIEKCEEEYMLHLAAEFSRFKASDLALLFES